MGELMTGSIRAYARHRGCTMQAVRKAIASQRISPEPDGKINFERADQDWQQNTRPRIAGRPATGGILVEIFRELRAIREAFERLKKKENYVIEN